MAIDNDTSYELTGAQIKDLAQKIRNKADGIDGFAKHSKFPLSDNKK